MAVAERWRLGPETCMAGDADIELRDGSRRVFYGALASAAARQLVPEQMALKPPGQWRPIGVAIPASMRRSGRTAVGLSFSANVCLAGSRRCSCAAHRRTPSTLRCEPGEATSRMATGRCEKAPRRSSSSGRMEQRHASSPSEPSSPKSLRRRLRMAESVSIVSCVQWAAVRSSIPVPCEPRPKALWCTAPRPHSMTGLRCTRGPGRAGQLPQLPPVAHGRVPCNRGAHGREHRLSERRRRAGAGASRCQCADCSDRRASAEPAAETRLSTTAASFPHERQLWLGNENRIYRAERACLTSNRDSDQPEES